MVFFSQIGYFYLATLLYNKVYDFKKFFIIIMKSGFALHTVLKSFTNRVRNGGIIMEKTQKKPITLITGISVLLVGIIVSTIVYGNATAKEATDSAKMLYALSLIATTLGIITTISGIRSLSVLEHTEKIDTKTLAQAALCAALCYIGFTFFKIDIPVGTEKTAIHFGNIFCVLAALLIGGFWGGMAGAVGMTIADLTTAYVTSAPKTFVLKLCIGLIVGLVAHKILKLSEEHNKKYIMLTTIGASVAGMIFNVIADPLVGYFYKTYLLGIPQDLAKVWAKIGTATTAVNAVTTVILASVLYLALRPALKKADLFVSVK